MIVVDSSALVAILNDEPERRKFIDVIVDYGDPRISVSTYLETSMVVELRMGLHAGRELDALLEDVGFSIIPFDRAQARVACDAFRRYGKGMHRAALNFGDCFSYALAKTLNVPLLFKGNDFALTDIKPAL